MLPGIAKSISSRGSNAPDRSELQALTFNQKGKRKALLDISAHYDISSELFVAFLSPDGEDFNPVRKPMPASARLDEALPNPSPLRICRVGDPF